MNQLKSIYNSLFKDPHSHLFSDNYWPQRSCGQGYVFTHVCDSVHRGGLWAGPPRTRQIPPWQGEPPGLGRHPPPPGPGRHQPPQTRQTPHSPWTRQTPPRPGRHPPRPGRHPPDQADKWQGEPPQTRQTPPPRKKTAAYGQWAAGTHPTGMHSCC